MQFTLPVNLWGWAPLPLHHPAHGIKLVLSEHSRQPRDTGGIEAGGAMQTQLVPSLSALLVQLQNPLSDAQARVLGVIGTLEKELYPSHKTITHSTQ